MAFIDIQNVTFRYPGAETDSLSEISFSMEKGEFLLLFGETGCGKSTLLRQLKPSICPAGRKTGKILVNGSDISELSKREEALRTGFVFQNPDNQIVTDKVWHELAFTLENLGVKSEEIRNRVSELAAFFGITDWFHKSVHELSGGQKQILNLASVMIVQPELLLLDEPTSQLDPIAAQKFIELLSRINEEFQTTIFMSEHRLDEVYPRADRCLVMEEGKLLMVDQPEKVTKFLAEEKKPYFDLLPSQVKIPVRMCNDYNCRTIRQAKDSLTKSQADRKKNVVFKKNELPPTMQKKPILEVKNIWFRYEKEGKDILRDFSMFINEGDFLAILGANGQGKSTLLNILCNLTKPYRGKVLIQNKKAGRGQIPKEIGLLPQNPQTLFLKSTVKEDLETVSYEIQDVVELLGLKEVLFRHPYDLSGGQQQMAAFAKVLLRKPKILLLDEPTKGIEKMKREQLGKVLRRLNEEGTTIILASHDIDFCAEYAKTTGMLFDGTMLSMGNVQEFCENQYFYTTSVRKIMRNIQDGIVTEGQVHQFENQEIE